MATDDKSILPEIQRNIYKRTINRVTEIKGSHAVYVSQPQKVAAIIVQAAKEVSKK